MKIYRVGEILKRLSLCINKDRPFSHIRFGDGGIKFIHSILFKDLDQLKGISKKEGIPFSMFNEVFDLWGYYARKADFVDTPEVYYTGNFWPRIKGPGKAINKATDEKMMMWKTLYRCAEFDNENYCNPESNYLMIVKNVSDYNLIDLMKDKKICIITARPKIKDILKDKGYYVDVVNIVGHYQDQYTNSFHKVIETITNSAKDYDFWMVAAGELGRIYTGHIKECGGRVIDIGFVVEFWKGEDLHPRLRLFMDRCKTNPLEIVLTEEGEKYRPYL